MTASSCSLRRFVCISQWYKSKEFGLTSGYIAVRKLRLGDHWWRFLTTYRPVLINRVWSLNESKFLFTYHTFANSICAWSLNELTFSSHTSLLQVYIVWLLDENNYLLISHLFISLKVCVIIECIYLSSNITLS